MKKLPTFNPHDPELSPEQKLAGWLLLADEHAIVRTIKDMMNDAAVKRYYESRGLIIEVKKPASSRDLDRR